MRGFAESSVLLPRATGSITLKQAWTGFVKAGDDVVSVNKVITFEECSSSAELVDSTWELN